MRMLYLDIAADLHVRTAHPILGGLLCPRTSYLCNLLGFASRQGASAKKAFLAKYISGVFACMHGGVMVTVYR